MSPPKSLSESIHVAALVACHWPTLVRCSSFVVHGSERYWIASKSRHERWTAWAARFETTRSLSHLDPELDVQFKCLLHEVFASELLTRTWAAAATIIDRTHGTREIEPYASSVFLTHQDIRHRCMRLIAKTHRSHAEQGRQLDQIRRRAERWSDMLLSHLSIAIDVTPWAFDVDRVTDFAVSTTSPDKREVADQLMIASILNSQFAKTTEGCLCPYLNERIVTSLLAAFGPDSIEAIGPFHRLWQSRLQHRSGDIANLISDIMN